MPPRTFETGKVPNLNLNSFQSNFQYHYSLFTHTHITTALIRICFNLNIVIKDRPVKI